MENDVITIGESLVSFIPDAHTKLRYVHQFSKVVAGAESNVAVGLSKLGYKAGWISKIGSDEFGAFLIRELRAEGVDTSRVITSDEGPTGLMFKQFSASLDSSVFYYRRGSAASTLCPEDIDWEYLAKTRIIHCSGITPALSSSCKQTVQAIFRFAKEKHILISFDPNIRRKLWSEEEAVRTLRPLLEQADIVLLGEEEGALLLGTEDPETIARLLLEQGSTHVGVKRGSKGSYVADANKGYFIEPYPVEVVDTIGAGDAFNAGFLAGLLDGLPTEQCGKMGSITGSLAVSSYGDVEGFPDRSTFDRIWDNTKEILR